MATTGGRVQEGRDGGVSRWEGASRPVSLAPVVRCAQDGCPRSFGELYSAMYDRVLAAAARTIRDRHEAEDVTQEAFLLAFRSLGGLSDPAAFEGWMLRIARNAAVNSSRRAARCRPSRRVHDDSVDGDRDLTRVVMRKGTAEVAPDALSRFRTEYRGMAPALRRTLEMRYEMGLPCVEIAAEQGVSVSCVKTRLHRARQVLSDALLD